MENFVMIAMVSVVPKLIDNGGSVAIVVRFTDMLCMLETKSDVMGISRDGSSVVSIVPGVTVLLVEAPSRGTQCSLS